MDELIDRVMAQVGIDREMARKAVGMVLGLLAKETSAEQAETVYEAFPGARELIDDVGGAAAVGGGGLFGGLLGSVGGSGVANALAALNSLQAEGLEINQVQDVAKEMLDYARENVGEERVSQVVSSIPGLDRFL